MASSVFSSRGSKACCLHAGGSLAHTCPLKTWHRSASPLAGLAARGEQQQFAMLSTKVIWPPLRYTRQILSIKHVPRQVATTLSQTFHERGCLSCAPPDLQVPEPIRRPGSVPLIIRSANAIAVSLALASARHFCFRHSLCFRQLCLSLGICIIFICHRCVYAICSSAVQVLTLMPELATRM